MEISDCCQYPGCNKRTAIWCDAIQPGGISACEEHEQWMNDAINAELEAKKIDDAIRNRDRNNDDRPDL